MQLYIYFAQLYKKFIHFDVKKGYNALHFVIKKHYLLSVAVHLMIAEAAGFFVQAF